MEKWTAADEKLWIELDARRAELRRRLRAELYNATVGLVRTDGMSEFLGSLIDNARAVHSALEPYVLLPEEVHE